MRTGNTWVVGLVLAVLIAGTVNGFAAEGDGSPEKEAEAVKIIPQTTCPVMGGKINKNLYVDHGGKRVYMCCEGCRKPLAKDPAKYIKALENKGVTVAKHQTTCPVMGGKINKKQYADVNGKRIYVCCPGCIGKIKADADKYIKKLEKDGVTLDTPPKPKVPKPSRDAREMHNHQPEKSQ